MFIPYEEYKIYLHDEKKLNSLLSNKKKKLAFYQFILRF